MRRKHLFAFFGLVFVICSNISNIRRQPTGGEFEQVTDFKTDRIFNFAFSANGHQPALSRGMVNSDVVLIENQK